MTNNVKMNRNYGYELLINTFEPILRKYIINEVFLINFGNDWKKQIPKGVTIELIKIKGEQISNNSSIDEFFEELNFLSLKDILIVSNNFKLAKSFFGELNKDKFIELMDDLNTFRRKIAHAKSTFSDFDLTTVIDHVGLLSQGEADNAKDIKRYLDNLEYKNAKDIPNDFFEDYECQNNLPSENYELDGGFVGRVKEIKSIKKLIQSDQDRIITITGAGGVGKTAIALRLAYSFLPDPHNKFEAIIWFSAKTNKLTDEGIVSMAPDIKSDMQLIEEIIGILDLETLQNFKEANVPAESYKTHLYKILSSQKCLLIIDNLETIINESALISFIKEIPRPSQALITSRKGLGEIERRYPLTDMAEKDAIQLFRIVAKERNRNDLLSLKTETISSLVKQVKCYPLLIKWSVGQVCLGKDINEAFSQIFEGDSEISKFTFNDVFSLLSENAKMILFSMIIYGEKSVSKYILMHLTNLSDDQFEDSIKELIITSFVFPESRDTESGVATEYSMLSLTRGFIENKLDDDEKVKEMLLTRHFHFSEQIQDFEKSKSSYSQSLFSLGIKSPEEQVAFTHVKAAKNFMRNNDIEEAEKNFKQAIKIAPKLSYVMTEYSKFEFGRGHVAEALKLAKRAVQHNPESYHAWFNCGITHKMARNYPESIKYLEKAKELNTKHLPIFSELGRVYTYVRDYEKAQIEFLDALKEEKYPNYRHKIMTLLFLADNYYRWADLFRDRQDIEGHIEKLTQASEIITEAIEIDSKDKRLWGLQRKICLSQGIVLSMHRGFAEGKPYLEESLKTIKSGNVDIAPHSKLVADSCFYLAAFGIKEVDYDIKQIENCINRGLANCTADSMQFEKLNRLKKEILGDEKTPFGDESRKYGSIKFFNLSKKYGVLNVGDDTHIFFISGFRERIQPETLSFIEGEVVSCTLIPNTEKKDQMIATDILFEEKKN